MRWRLSRLGSRASGGIGRRRWTGSRRWLPRKSPHGRNHDLGRCERDHAAPRAVDPALPEILFALWTEPAQLVKWWAPDGYEAAVHTFDARPGGRWRIVLRGADGGSPAL